MCVLGTDCSPSHDTLGSRTNSATKPAQPSPRDREATQGPGEELRGMRSEGQTASSLLTNSRKGGAAPPTLLSGQAHAGPAFREPEEGRSRSEGVTGNGTRAGKSQPLRRGLVWFLITGKRERSAMKSEKLSWGVPVVVQQKRTHRGTMRLRVQSLASLSG